MKFGKLDAMYLHHRTARYQLLYLFVAAANASMTAASAPPDAHLTVGQRAATHTLARSNRALGNTGNCKKTGSLRAIAAFLIIKPPASASKRGACVRSGCFPTATVSMSSGPECSAAIHDRDGKVLFAGAQTRLEASQALYLPLSVAQRNEQFAAVLPPKQLPVSRHAPMQMLAKKGSGGFGGFGGDGKRKGGKGKRGKGGGSGFSKAIETPQDTSSDGQMKLEADAEAALQRCGGNLDRAQATFFQESMLRLREEDPELFKEMAPQERSAVRQLSGRSHEKLVELTWDTIAAFMPSEAGTPGDVKRKLQVIAKAVCGSPADRGAVAVLDVGCGNGAAVPFLSEEGADLAQYVGLDLSSRMIQAAKRKHAAAGARFEQGSFVNSPAASPPVQYDAVLFNGALQFFSDQRDVLRRAAELVPRGGGRVVLSHVNGASFVRDEMARNPQTVQSSMPSLDTLQGQAHELGMRVLGPAEVGLSAPKGAEAALEDFYLVVLERTA